MIVEPRTATDLPSQAEIDSQARQELAPLEDLTDGNQKLVASGQAKDKESGPGGKPIWFVSAGLGRPEAEVLEFHPKNLTITQGDAVVWVSSRFHAVTFDPTRQHTPFYVPKTQPEGPPIVYINPEVLFPSTLSGEYDGEGFFSSGLMGQGTRPGGIGVSVTFTKPGTFVYTCPIHHEAGMTGTITVRAP